MAPAARHVPDAANPAPDSDRPGYPIPGPPAGAENGKSASAAREPREEKPPDPGPETPLIRGRGMTRWRAAPGPGPKNIPWGRRKPGHALFIYGAGAAL